MPLLRLDTDERIETGDEFDARERELRVWGDRIEELGAGEAVSAAESEGSGSDETHAAGWLTDIDGIGDAKADALAEAGFDNPTRVAEASHADIEAAGVAEHDAQAVKAAVSDGE